MIGTMSRKKEFIYDRKSILTSIVSTINENKPFTYLLRQFGYMDIISIGWVASDNETVLMADIMARCEPELIDGKKCIFIKEMTLLAVSEVIPDYYKSDRKIRPKDVAADDFIPLIIEHEFRHNVENPNDTITYFINQRILKSSS